MRRITILILLLALAFPAFAKSQGGGSALYTGERVGVSQPSAFWLFTRWWFGIPIGADKSQGGGSSVEPRLCRGAGLMLPECRSKQPRPVPLCP